MMRNTPDSSQTEAAPGTAGDSTRRRRLVAGSLAAAILVALATIGASAVFAGGPNGEKPAAFHWAGEEFFYSIRVNGVEAVRAAVRAGDVRYKDGHPYVPVSGQAQSTGFFNSVYPIDDRAHTFLSPTTLRPLRSEKYFDEAGKQRSYKVDFVHSTYQARVVKERPERKRKFTTGIPGTTHDMITWFYDLRSRGPFDVGDRMSFYVYDGWKLSRLDGHVSKREDIYTPMGWFKTWRVDFKREVLRSRRNKNGKPPILKVRTPSHDKGSLWLSRDQNMLPIKVAVETKWGVGEAVIIKYKPGKVARERLE